ncbi:hypothetical protein, partial [Rhodopirellula baltica]|uniref:hypothetical protein n=1 Tax=Rhodopirellula baltica TaxID=265606 RepID=UPI001F2A8B2E
RNHHRKTAANAERLISAPHPPAQHISRRTLVPVLTTTTTSTTAGNAERLTEASPTIAPLPILGLANVHDDLFQFIFFRNAFPIASHGPDWTVDENGPTLPQDSSAVGLDLIANFPTTARVGGQNNVHMVGSSTDAPQFPMAKYCQPLGFGFDRITLQLVKQYHLVIQPISMPLLKEWLRWLHTIFSTPPPPCVTLQKGSIHGERDEITWRLNVHGSSRPRIAPACAQRF